MLKEHSDRGADVQVTASYTHQGEPFQDWSTHVFTKRMVKDDYDLL